MSNSVLRFWSEFHWIYRLTSERLSSLQQPLNQQIHFTCIFFLTFNYDLLLHTVIYVEIIFSNCLLLIKRIIINFYFLFFYLETSLNFSIRSKFPVDSMQAIVLLVYDNFVSYVYFLYFKILSRLMVFFFVLYWYEFIHLKYTTCHIMEFKTEEKVDVPL